LSINSGFTTVATISASITLVVILLLSLGILQTAEIAGKQERKSGPQGDI
jgi:hypothetical protein